MHKDFGVFKDPINNSIFHTQFYGSTVKTAAPAYFSIKPGSTEWTEMHLSIRARGKHFKISNKKLFRKADHVLMKVAVL